MAIQGLAHFAADIFFMTFTIHRCGQVLFKGNAVNLRVARLAQRIQSGIIDNHGLRLVFANESIETVFLPVQILTRPLIDISQPRVTLSP